MRGSRPSIPFRVAHEVAALALYGPAVNRGNASLSATEIRKFTLELPGPGFVAATDRTASAHARIDRFLGRGGVFPSFHAAAARAS
jgi:hypothetical protein